MNADEARRVSDEASGKGLHSELRGLVDVMVEGQAAAGQRSVLIARQLKFPAHSYAALFEELKKDGYQVDASGGNELFTVSW